MPRFRHPITVGLAISDWPEPVRARWFDAIADGDDLLDGGGASHWSQKTRISTEKALGQFLRFARELDLIRNGDLTPDCIRSDTLRAYLLRLQERLAPLSTLTLLRRLSSAIRVLYPDFDREVLICVIARLDGRTKPQDKDLTRLPKPGELLRLGLDLMDWWRERDAHDLRCNAADYRNGLMIAFLALCPVRLGNLAQMRVGQHIDLKHRPVRLSFEEAEVNPYSPSRSLFASPLMLQIAYIPMH